MRSNGLLRVWRPGLVRALSKEQASIRSIQEESLLQFRGSLAMYVYHKAERKTGSILESRASTDPDCAMFRGASNR